MLVKVTFKRVENRLAEPFLKNSAQGLKIHLRGFLGRGFPSFLYQKNLPVETENGSTNGNVEVVRKGKTLSRHLTDLP